MVRGRLQYLHVICIDIYASINYNCTQMHITWGKDTQKHKDQATH